MREAGGPVTLGSLCERITVGHVGPMANSYTAIGVPFLRSQDIGEFHINTSDIKFIPPEFEQKLRKSRLRAGDVAIVRTGYPGTAAVVPQELDGANCADLVILTPGRELDAWFVASLLNSAWGRGHVSGVLVGVAQQHFNVGAARDLKTVFPPLRVQQRIGSLVRTYCDLIEVNQRRIAILEDMARRLFDEWFVRFRYPGREAVPLVEMELGMVPEGWQIETARQALTYTGGGTPSKAEPSYWHDGDIQWFTPTDLTKSGQTFLRRSSLMITKEGLAKSSARLFPAFSIMMTSRATLGVFAINTEPATTNQGFITFIPTNRTPVYFLLHMLKREFPRMEAIASGATFKEITKGALGELVFLFPPEHLAHRFEQLVTPMMEQMAIISRQNDSLRAARDLLLPKLISGEIDVSTAEETFAEAAE